MVIHRHDSLQGIGSLLLHICIRGRLLLIGICSSVLIEVHRYPAAFKCDEIYGPTLRHLFLHPKYKTPRQTAFPFSPSVALSLVHPSRRYLALISPSLPQEKSPRHLPHRFRRNTPTSLCTFFRVEPRCRPSRCRPFPNAICQRQKLNTKCVVVLPDVRPEPIAAEWRQRRYFDVTEVWQNRKIRIVRKILLEWINNIYSVLQKCLKRTSYLHPQEMRGMKAFTPSKKERKKNRECERAREARGRGLGPSQTGLP